MFVGYQAIGTLGRLILDGKKEVRILGQHYRIKAKIVRVNGFSAHADRDELFTWLSKLEAAPRKLFVVHGEAENSKALADYIGGKTNWDIMVPNYKDEVFLD